LDLGELVVEFEQPRMCEISISSVFSGAHTAGRGGPLVKGDAVVGASVRGQLAGGVQLPQAAVAALCEGSPCSPAVVPNDGIVTFVVPVVGEAPEIQVDASFSLKAEGSLHYYSGSIVVPGCTGSETSLPTTSLVCLDHAALGDLSGFIEALGDGPKLPVVNPGSSDPLAPPNDPLGGGCGCRQAGGHGAGGATQTLAGALLLAFGMLARRRKWYMHTAQHAASCVPLLAHSRLRPANPRGGM